MNYYNPKKILSIKDLDNETPSIYIITTNRSAGKTTSFLKKSLEDYKENKSQVVLMYRYKYELKASADIYKDVLTLYPDLGVEMKCVPHADGLYYELFLDNESFGYAVSLANPDALKKYSPIFSKVKQIIFDEFQTETGKYLPKEIKKFQSLYLTIARGGGKQSRKVFCFRCSTM